MFDGKPKQEVGNNSTGVQAGNDVNITNYGLNYSQVREIFHDLFNNQFPKLKEDAHNQAKINAELFENIFIRDLKHRIENILIEKFKDPDVQATLNDALNASARKGIKSNPDILSRLLIEKVTKDSNDFQDIVITEAIKVVPMLNINQLSFISTAFIINNLVHSFLADSAITSLENFHTILKPMVDRATLLSEAQTVHISYTGACSISPMMGMDGYEIYSKRYSPIFGEINDKATKDKIREISPNTIYFLDTFRKLRLGTINLTSVGQAIAIATLLPNVPSLDYKMWLK